MTTLARDSELAGQEAAAALERALQGQLLRPGDAAYEEARQVWNGMIDRRPALIARCETVDDVVAAVNAAREHRLLLSVRGGAHSVADHGVNDGGLVIDLSPMDQVTVDPEKRVVRAQGEATSNRSPST